MREYINAIPTECSLAYFQKKKYGLSKTIFNHGYSIKIYAEELAGNDYISLNFYITRHREHLKPCEMPVQKVIKFLKEINIARCK